MANRPNVKTRRLTREKLAQFLPTHELIKAFEDMASDVSETLPDAIEDSATDAGSVIVSTSFARPIVMPPPPDGEAGKVLAVQAFARPVPRPAAPDDAASHILATQIFGA